MKDQTQVTKDKVFEYLLLYGNAMVRTSIDGNKIKQVRINPENQEINHSNKLIADFMGLHWHDNGTISNYPTAFNMRMGVDTVDDLKFHTSWDWLMPVVDKIEALDLKDRMYEWELNGEIQYNFQGISVEIENNNCWIYCNLQLDPCFTLNEETNLIKYESKIDAVFFAVIEFINWYNNQNINRVS